MLDAAPDMTLIACGLIFGSIGFGYFIYGKKQQHIVARYCGIGLMVLPYVSSSVWFVVSIALLLMLLPRYFEL
jgi:hypothetical protein